MVFSDWLKPLGGVVALAAFFLASAPAEHAQMPELAAKGIILSIQRKDITVSGFSSGAAMAHQLHIAHSADLVGVGMVAGPPFRCADYFKGNSIYTSDVVAMTICTAYHKKLKLSVSDIVGIPIDLARLQALANEAFEANRVDPKYGLCGDRVFLIAGGKDDTVPVRVTQATKKLYEWLLNTCQDVVPVEQLILPEMPHTMPTNSSLEERHCAAGAPYIADCDFPAGEHILKFLHPAKATAPQANRSASRNNLFPFDQHRILGATQPKGLMHQNGYIYVPDTCQHGEPCSLHVAFHGCHQNEGQINEGSQNQSKMYLFAVDAGYNEFAERNSIVVLYPQVSNTSPVNVNPSGCWDWWGYNGPDYYQKGALQIRNIWRIVEEVAKPHATGS